MSFLLDTNICSAFLKRPERLAHRFMTHGGQLNLSTVVLAELLTWAHQRNDSQLLDLVEHELVQVMTVYPFDVACASEYGALRARQLAKGRVVDPTDLMIAATALAHDLTVVTANTRHFADVPGLRLVNWLE